MINIYYLSYCPYSQKALKILDKYKINHCKIESSDNKEERKKIYKTFPQIYWNESLIGGYDNFMSIINSLRTIKEPIQPDEWDNKEWYRFLLHIAKQI